MWNFNRQLVDRNISPIYMTKSIFCYHIPAVWVTDIDQSTYLEIVRRLYQIQN